MPRVTDDHLAARRRQILDGARRCFAEYGYDKATVRRLEQTIGLSRGAIFHHFRDKDTLFFELAREDAERMADVASREGLVQVMRDMLAAPEEFDWLATRLEIARKLRNDPAFNKGWSDRSAELSTATTERLRRQKQAGRLRDDVPSDVLQTYLDLVLDGLVARLASGDDPEKLSAVLELVEASLRQQETYRARLRWLGPPRLRIVVPDSRNMLWTEPYERPVLATNVRMLAPPSYALRNSFRSWSRDLFSFFIDISPRLMPRRIPSVRRLHTPRVDLKKRFEIRVRRARSDRDSRRTRSPRCRRAAAPPAAGPVPPPRRGRASPTPPRRRNCAARRGPARATPGRGCSSARRVEARSPSMRPGPRAPSASSLRPTRCRPSDPAADR